MINYYYISFFINNDKNLFEKNNQSTLYEKITLKIDSKIIKLFILLRRKFINLNKNKIY